eukprot:5529782-Amphidinium_carterae.1
MLLRRVEVEWCFGDFKDSPFECGHRGQTLFLQQLHKDDSAFEHSIRQLEWVFKMTNGHKPMRRQLRKCLGRTALYLAGGHGSTIQWQRVSTGAEPDDDHFRTVLWCWLEVALG